MESALFFLALDNQTHSIQLLNPVRKVVFGGTEKKSHRRSERDLHFLHRYYEIQEGRSGDGRRCQIMVFSSLVKKQSAIFIMPHHPVSIPIFSYLFNFRQRETLSIPMILAACVLLPSTLLRTERIYSRSLSSRLWLELTASIFGR